MSIILPVAVIPTRTVSTWTNGFNPAGGYALIRYQNIQGGFSLTTLTYQDVFQPPNLPGFEWVQLSFSWRAIIVIRSFDPLTLDAFGQSKPRRKYGYYTTGYADIDSSLQYINFDKQFTGYYAGLVNENGFASWVDNFPPPLVPLTRFYTVALAPDASRGARDFATLIKGELSPSVIADIYISALYSWVQDLPEFPYAFVDV